MLGFGCGHNPCNFAFSSCSAKNEETPRRSEKKDHASSRRCPLLGSKHVPNQRLIRFIRAETIELLNLTHDVTRLLKVNYCRSLADAIQRCIPRPAVYKPGDCGEFVQYAG